MRVRRAGLAPRETPFPPAAETGFLAFGADLFPCSLQGPVFDSDAAGGFEDRLGRKPGPVVELGEQELAGFVEGGAFLVTAGGEERLPAVG